MKSKKKKKIPEILPSQNVRLFDIFEYKFLPKTANTYLFSHSFNKRENIYCFAVAII